MSVGKSINRVGITTIVGALLVQLGNFVLIPIMTRALGTSGFGTVSLYTAWCTIATAVFGLQTTQAVIYIVAEKETRVQNEYLATMLSYSATSFFSASLVAITISCIFDKAHLPVFVGTLFLQAFGTYCINFANTVFTQRQQPEKQIALSAFVTLSTAILSIMLVNNIENATLKYYGRIFGYAVPYTILGFILFGCYVFPNMKNIRIRYAREFLPICLPMVIHSLAAIIFSQSDRVMLGYMCGKDAAGVYSFTYSISSLLSVAWVTLNSFFQPFLFSYLKSDDVLTIRSKTGNLLALYTAVYAVFLLVIPEIAIMFGGKEFASAIGFVPILSLGVYFNFLYSFNSNFEIYYKKTALIAKGTTLSAIINVFLNVLLIPRYSVGGASIATLISFVALFVFHYLNARHTARIHSVEYVFSGKGFILWAFGAGAVSLFSHFLGAYMIARLVLVGVILSLTLMKMARQKSII